MKVISTMGLHRWSAVHKEPVVCVLQGIQLYYFSLETMLKTCIESVNHSTCSTDESDLAEETEEEIWQKLNPSIFSEQF